MASNEWRWYLFLIPIVLGFFLCLGLLYHLHQRRRALKARRSTLRNVTLVLQEDEKVKAKQERLSRMGSTRSNLSRMTSTKSSYSRTPIGREMDREHRRLRNSMNKGNPYMSRDNAREGLRLDGNVEEEEDDIHVIGREDEIDLESQDHHDTIKDDDHQINRRKEILSVIGESQGELSRISDSAGISTAADESFNSQPPVASTSGSLPSATLFNSSTPSKSVKRSVSGTSAKNGAGGSGGDPFISPVTAISQNSSNDNPFSSPRGINSAVSDHHEPEAFSTSNTPAPVPVAQSKTGLGLARKLSEVVRLKSPIPPARSTTPSKKSTGDSSERDQMSLASNNKKVSSDTFGVGINAKRGTSGSGSGNQLSSNNNNINNNNNNNGRTSISSSRSITTQMIGAPAPSITSGSSSAQMVTSPMRSNSIDAQSTSKNGNPTDQIVGGSEWTYVSRANEWRKPRKSSDNLSSNQANASARARVGDGDYLIKHPNPLGLLNVPKTSDDVKSNSRSPSLKAQSATHLPLPKANDGNRSGNAGLKRAVSIGAAGSKFKETFDDSP